MPTQEQRRAAPHAQHRPDSGPAPEAEPSEPHPAPGKVRPIHVERIGTSGPPSGRTTADNPACITS